MTDKQQEAGMIRASNINETWFNPAFVVSFRPGENGSLTLEMLNGKQVVVSSAEAREVSRILTDGRRK